MLAANGVVAQDFEWVKAVGGNSNEVGNGVTTDPSGNVISVGDFFESADFDPGAGSTILSPVGSFDVYIQKLNANGDFMWARSIGGMGYDFSASVKSDAAGNIFITGGFQETVDFDPGVGVFNVTAIASYETFVLKLDPNGDFVWVSIFVGAYGYSNGTSLALDATGNVYTTGYFEDSVDFDPGSGVSIQFSQGGSDVFIQKMDNNGNFLWAKTFGGGGNEEGLSTVDAAGNVFTTGFFTGSVDFDPGAGSTVLTPTLYYDGYVQKLDANGNFVWAKGLNGTGYEIGKAIRVDDSGNVLVAGEYDLAMDADPGAGTFTLTTAGAIDAFILKLDANGDFIWAKSVGGTTTDRPYGLDIDALDNIYVTGTFSGTTDLDPGANVVSAVSQGADDIFILKLNASGAYVWSTYTGGTSYEASRSVALSNDGFVYITGGFNATVDFDAGSGVTNATAVGGYDHFVLKTSQCSPDATTDVQTACGSFQWINGTTYTMSDSTATYLLTNVEGCDSIVTLNLTVTNVNVNVTDNSPTLSANQTGASYQWIDCNNGNAAITGATNQTFTASTNGNYAVIVTQNNCSDTSACFLVDNVGLNKLQQNALLIYPNPSNGVFTVELSGKLNEITLLDVSGRAVSVDVDLNSGKVDARNVAPGNYIIQVRTNAQEVVLKSISIQ